MTQTVQREAISYGRFSTTKQETGDSVKRQEQAYRDVLRDCPFLTESSRYGFGKLFDHGVSSFHGKNVSGGHLGQLLILIRQKIIVAPAVLVIEQWSRFSRGFPDLAIGHISEIVRTHGIDIIINTPREHITAENFEDKITMITMLLQLARSESKFKSKMVRGANERKLTSGKPIRGKCPSWLRWEDGKYVFNDDAPLLKKACELSIAGYGGEAIRRQLGIVGSKWSNLPQIFASKALIGEFQPLARIGKTTEAIRHNYYPSLLTEVEFYSLQEAVKKRATVKVGASGRSPAVVNLFPNLIYSAHDGSPLWIRNQWDGERFLLSKKQHQENASNKRTVRYSFVEETILMAFTDIDETDLYPAEANRLAEQITTLKGKIGRQQENITVWTSEALAGACGLSKLISQAWEQMEALQSELDACQRERTKDIPNALGTVKDIVGYLAGLEGDELLDARVRLRKLLPQLVQRIEVEISGYRSASFRCVLSNGRILDVDGSGSKWGTVVVGEEFAAVG